jgi:aspartyl-tRNA(Asn)/glutamyl-tRNA(Gln) amidotransferase subunit A
LQDLKIGFNEIDFSEWPDEPLRPAFANALRVVKSFGSQMVETRLPDFPYGPLIGAIIDSEAASVFEHLIRSGAVDQLADQSQIDGLKASMNYSAVDYLKAMRVRSQIQAAFRELFANLDVLVAPTRLSAPDRADQPFDETQPKRPDQKGVAAGLVQASNLCGLPALSIPCGFVNGLPIGTFLAASHCREEVGAGKLAAIPLGPEPMIRRLALIYRKDKSLSKAALGFIQVTLEHAGNQIHAAPLLRASGS